MHQSLGRDPRTDDQEFRREHRIEDHRLDRTRRRQKVAQRIVSSPASPGSIRPSWSSPPLLLAFVPPLLVGPLHRLVSTWLHRALIFLVVSCPCALVVSVPLTFFGGLGGASRRGILVKGSNYMDALAKVGTVVFDKTGTLTRGEFAVEAIHPDDFNETELLHLAAPRGALL